MQLIYPLVNISPLDTNDIVIVYYINKLSFFSNNKKEECEVFYPGKVSNSGNVIRGEITKKITIPAHPIFDEVEKKNCKIKGGDVLTNIKIKFGVQVKIDNIDKNEIFKSKKVFKYTVINTKDWVEYEGKGLNDWLLESINRDVFNLIRECDWREIYDNSKKEKASNISNDYIRESLKECITRVISDNYNLEVVSDSIDIELPTILPYSELKEDDITHNIFFKYYHDESHNIEQKYEEKKIKEFFIQKMAGVNEESKEEYSSYIHDAIKIQKNNELSRKRELLHIEKSLAEIDVELAVIEFSKKEKIRTHEVKIEDEEHKIRLEFDINKQVDETKLKLHNALLANDLELKLIDMHLSDELINKRKKIRNIEEPFSFEEMQSIHKAKYNDEIKKIEISITEQSAKAGLDIEKEKLHLELSRVYANIISQILDKEQYFAHSTYSNNERQKIFSMLTDSLSNLYAETTRICLNSENPEQTLAGFMAVLSKDIGDNILGSTQNNSNKTDNNNSNNSVGNDLIY